MDSSRFGAWTRRKLGLASAILAGSAFGVAGASTGAKKKKKKRCIKEDDQCASSLNRDCCKGLSCKWDPDYFENSGSYACLK